MSARHAKPLVVRLWKSYTEDSINALVADWDHGTFTLPASHPVVNELRNVHKQSYVLTVLDTEELEWEPHTVNWGGTTARIQCRPRHEQLRLRLRADEWLTSRGLAS